MANCVSIIVCFVRASFYLARKSDLVPMSDITLSTQAMLCFKGTLKSKNIFAKMKLKIVVTDNTQVSPKSP